MLRNAPGLASIGGTAGPNEAGRCRAVVVGAVERIIRW